jgi:segregation and condensation protein A
MYRVQLQQFEGPMDLLLFFIKRDEIDIYDIPIAQIADEYLAYVRLLERIDLDGVGDFIYMAALLINIKARMLLPSQEVDEDGEPIDPRQELVERLLEYVRFKEAASQLENEAERRAQHFTRGEASAEREELQDNHEPEVADSLYDLITVLGDMLRKAPDEEEPIHEVEPHEYSIEEQQRYVFERLDTGRPVSFRTLVYERPKAFIIATFLAVLEMVRQGHLHVLSEAASFDFQLQKREGVTLSDVQPAPVNGASLQD